MNKSTNSIKVVLRFRPQNRREIESGGGPIVSFDSDDTCKLDVSCPFLKCFGLDIGGVDMADSR